VGYSFGEAPDNGSDATDKIVEADGYVARQQVSNPVTGIILCVNAHFLIKNSDYLKMKENVL